jgi:hypothetical protein
VDRQERLCREVAERLGLVIVPGCVFVDNNRSAWQRNHCRPGWDGLLEAIRAGRVAHVLVYHPDRLMRQPRDLEELLTLSDEHDITLHGQANYRDLSDADDRFFLRIEVAHACRSSDDTTRTAESPSTPFLIVPIGFPDQHRQQFLTRNAERISQSDRKPDPRRRHRATPPLQGTQIRRTHAGQASYHSKAFLALVSPPPKPHAHRHVSRALRTIRQRHPSQ